MAEALKAAERNFMAGQLDHNEFYPNPHDQSKIVNGVGAFVIFRPLVQFKT
jgi:hypothetical protein